MYSKKVIADAIVKFINNDILNDIDNQHSKFALCMAKKALHENPDLLDGFFDNPIVSSVVKESDDMYDIDLFARTVKNVLSEYDNYTIHIPKIPIFASKDSVMNITATDVDKIISYMQPVTV